MLSRAAAYASTTAAASARALSTASVRRQTVYLAGEIHTSWREEVIEGARARAIPVDFTTPNVVHEDSDDAGCLILDHLDDAALSRAHYDSVGARLNAVRNRTLIAQADIMVARWDECKYKQWNAAFDAGMACASDIPLVTLHPESFGHMLKEVNAGALASCRTPEQVVDVLDYVVQGNVPKKAGFTPWIERK